MFYLLQARVSSLFFTPPPTSQSPRPSPASSHFRRYPVCALPPAPIPFQAPSPLLAPPPLPPNAAASLPLTKSAPPGSRSRAPQCPAPIRAPARTSTDTLSLDSNSPMARFQSIPPPPVPGPTKYPQKDLTPPPRRTNPDAAQNAPSKCRCDT